MVHRDGAEGGIAGLGRNWKWPGTCGGGGGCSWREGCAVRDSVPRFWTMDCTIPLGANPPPRPAACPRRGVGRAGTTPKVGSQRCGGLGIRRAARRPCTRRPLSTQVLAASPGAHTPFPSFFLPFRQPEPRSEVPGHASHPSMGCRPACCTPDPTPWAYTSISSCDLQTHPLRLESCSPRSTSCLGSWFTRGAASTLGTTTATFAHPTACGTSATTHTCVACPLPSSIPASPHN